MTKKHYKSEHFLLSTVLSVTALFVIAAALVVCNLLFTSHLKKELRLAANNSLEEVSRTVAESVDAKIEASFSKLRLAAHSYGDIAVKQNSPERAHAFLQQNLALTGFARFLFATPDGEGWATDGGETVNVAGLDVFKSALQNGWALSGKTASVVDGSKNIIVYAVTVVVDGNVEGVLMSSHTNENLKSLLNVTTFGGEGYFYLFLRNGDFVFLSDEDGNFAETNFYEMIALRGSVDSATALETVKTDLSNGRSGIFYYTAGGTPTASYYTPLSSCDWRIILNVPVSVIDAPGGNAAFTATLISFITAGLVVLIVLYMSVVQGISRRKLTRLAYCDSLTGGMNNTRFEMEAEKRIAAAAPMSYAYVLFNIRQFKLLNNTYGSNEGDRLIRYVYRKLEQALFEGELASRMSADKFNLLLRYTSNDDLRARLDAITGQINAFNNLRAAKYYISTSSLVYVVDNSATTVTQARDCANVMKIAGDGSSQNVCLFYSNADRVRMLKDKSIADRMEQALKNNEFIVYYQPKYTAATEKLAGAEALVRWKELDKLMPPSYFIPVFERNGFITKLDLFVFRKTCDFLQNLKDENRPLLPISVNLSRRHLENPDFLEPYVRIFSEYDFAPRYLDFEITESLAIENTGMLIDALKEIHSHGFTCSIDDFGSGYSSLNLIKDLPIDTLKIDKQFFDVTSMNDRRSISIVETILDLAHKLNLGTVAEGVETKEQVAFLKASGCDLIQGYVFSRPVPEEDFRRTLKFAQQAQALPDGKAAERPTATKAKNSCKGLQTQSAPESTQAVKSDAKRRADENAPAATDAETQGKTAKTKTAAPASEAATKPLASARKAKTNTATAKKTAQSEKRAENGDEREANVSARKAKTDTAKDTAQREKKEKEGGA